MFLDENATYLDMNPQNNSSLWNEPFLDTCLEKGISPITGKDNRKQGVCRGTTLAPNSKSPCKTLFERGKRERKLSTAFPVPFLIGAGSAL